jgi:NitT/TauT family transport system substrate-binding protein
MCKPIYKPISIFIFATFMLASCTFPGTQTPAEDEPITLKVLSLPFISFAPLFIANNEGYFAEQGITIEFSEEFKRSSEALPALAQGEIDVIAGSPYLGFFNAIVRGENVKYVAGKGFYDPEGCTYTAVIAGKELFKSGELTFPADLAGRTISMNHANHEGYAIDKLLHTVNLSLDDLNIVDVPTPSEAEALGNGSVEMITTNEPWITVALDSGNGEIWIRNHEIVPDFDFALISFGPSLLIDNPEAGKRFMTAYLKGIEQYNLGKTERNIEILLNVTELDQQILMDSCWPPMRADGSINTAGILDFQSWAIERELLDTVATEEQFWDPRFIEHANSVLDTP